MQTAGGGFAAAVTAQDQLVDYSVTVSLPVGVSSYYQDLTKCTVSVDIDRAVVTSLPDGTTLISGYPSAAATIVLAGMLGQAPGVPLSEYDTVYRLFNPNDSSSAMWRQTRGGLPVTVKAGLWDGGTSADLVTQYTGTVDQVTCSNGVVTLVCRDQRSTVTNQAALPPVITQAPYNSGLTSEFAIDSLARHASPQAYYSWPKLRPNCRLAVGFRSSIWPDLGTQHPWDEKFEFGDGVFGTALTNTFDVDDDQATSIIYDLSEPITPSESIWMEAWMGPGSTIYVDCDFLDTGIAQYVILYFDNTQVVISTDTTGGTAYQEWDVATTGKQYVACQVHWTPGSTTVTGTMYLGAATHAISFTALAARSTTANFLCGDAQVDSSVGGGSLEGFQVSAESAGVSNNGFTPTLILDPSLNSLTALPDVAGKDSWSVLQDIAAAEAGVIGFDENGVLRFVNRQSIKAMTSVRSISSSQSLVGLDSLEQMSLCATHVTSPVNQISIGQPEFVWSATSVIAVDPGTPTVVLISTSDPVVNVPKTDSGFYYAGGVGGPAPVAGHTYWQASTKADGTGLSFGGGVFGGSLSMTFDQLSTTQILVTITNTTYLTLYLAQPTGWPGPTGVSVGAAALYVGGQAVSSASVATTAANLTGTVTADAQWPPVSSGGAVSNPQFGEVLLPLPANSWLQSGNSADLLVDDLLSDLHYPVPLWRNLTIVADPRLQLLDVVTVVDPDVSQVNDYGLIVGIQTRLSATDWSQTIDARPLAPPGGWLLGVAGRSELGTTTYLY